MTAPRTDLTITLEEELPSPAEGAPRRLRLSTSLHAPEGKALGAPEIAGAVKALEEQMRYAKEAALPPGSVAPSTRADRPAAELMEAYRPKSVELVDALLWEGELSPTEHEALKAAVAELAGKPPRREPPAPRPSSPSATSSPPASASLTSTPTTPHAPASPPAPDASKGAAPARFGPARPTDSLVKELDLRNIRDVNLARSRRLISFDEWSALKAHFERRPA